MVSRAGGPHTAYFATRQRSIAGRSSRRKGGRRAGSVIRSMVLATVSRDQEVPLATTHQRHRTEG